jgi:hypothetical protein
MAISLVEAQEQSTPASAPAASPSQSVEVQSVQSPAPKAQPKGVVSGHVILSDTRGPGRGARVLLLPVDPKKSGDVEASSQQLMGIAGLDGSFLIPRVAPGEYAVIGLSVGYLSPLDGLWVDPTDTSAGSEDKVRKLLLESNAAIVSIHGSETANAEIELTRGAVLSGRVLYSDGSPASQTHVQLQKVEEKEDKIHSPGNEVQIGTIIQGSLLHQSLATDDQGHFRIPGIPAGTYRLAVPVVLDNVSEMEAMLATYSGGALAGTAGKLTIYSGSTLHRKQAKTFDLRPGDSVDGIEITLPISGLHNVQGVVNSKQGIPLTYASLELVDTTDSSITFHATVHNDGQFRFCEVPEGTYELKTSNARMYAQPMDDNVPDYMMPMMQQQLKATHAFADMTQSIIVQNSDVSDVILALPETPLTDLPSPSDSGVQATAGPPVAVPNR